MRTQHDLDVANLKRRWSGALWALRVFTLLAYAANMVVNYVGNLGDFGETNSEVSAKYPTLLTPAGYAFAIWGLIFTLQGLYAVYGVLPVDDEKLRYIVLLNLFVPLGWIGEAVWTPFFNQELIPYTVFFISGSCLLFMVAYIRVTSPDHSLQLYEAVADLFSGETQAHSIATLLKKVFYYLIFVAQTGLNFGWLVVASIVNCLILLQYLEVEVSVAAAIGCIVFANAVAVVFLAWRRDVIVALVQVWAITAISVKQTNSTIVSACYVSLSVLAVLILSTLVISIVSQVRQQRKSRAAYSNVESGYALPDMYFGAYQ